MWTSTPKWTKKSICCKSRVAGAAMSDRWWRQCLWRHMVTNGVRGAGGRSC